MLQNHLDLKSKEILQKLNNIETKQSQTYIKQIERYILNLTSTQEELDDLSRRKITQTSNKELDMLNKKITQTSNKKTKQESDLNKKLIESEQYANSYIKRSMNSKIDINDLTPEDLSEIAELTDYEIRNDKDYITYIKTDGDTLTFHQVKLFHHMNGEIRLSPPIKYKTRNVPKDIMRKLSKYFEYDEIHLKKEYYINIVGQDNTNIRGLTLRYDNSGQLLNESEISTAISSQGMSNNGLNPVDYIYMANEVNIFQPIPTSQNPTTRRINSNKFKQFFQGLYDKYSDMSSDTILKALVQSIIEYRPKKHLTFIVSGSRMGLDKNIISNFLQLLFSTDFNKLVKTESDIDRDIYTCKYDNPYIMLHHTASVNYGIELAKKLGFNLTNISQELYNYFGDFLFEEGFKIYYNILKDRVGKIFEYGMPVEISSKLNPDMSENIFSPDEQKCFTDLIDLVEMESDEFKTFYEKSNKYKDFNILRECLKLNSIRQKEFDMWLNEYNITFNSIESILTQHNILGQSNNSTRYIDKKQIKVRSISLDNLKTILSTQTTTYVNNDFDKMIECAIQSTSQTPPQTPIPTIQTQSIEDLISSPTSESVTPEYETIIDTDFSNDEETCLSQMKRIERDLEWNEKESNRIRIELDDLKDHLTEDETSIEYEESSEAISLLEIKLNILNEESIELSTKRFDLSCWIQSQFRL